MIMIKLIDGSHNSFSFINITHDSENTDNEVLFRGGITDSSAKLQHTELQNLNPNVFTQSK